VHRTVGTSRFEIEIPIKQTKPKKWPISHTLTPDTVKLLTSKSVATIERRPPRILVIVLDEALDEHCSSEAIKRGR